MSETTLISIRVPVKAAARFQELADALQRSKSFLGAEAIEEYLSLNEWHIAAIKQGIKSANAGKLVAHEDVTVWVESWGTPKEKGTPECE